MFNRRELIKFGLAAAVMPTVMNSCSNQGPAGTDMAEGFFFITKVEDKSGGKVKSGNKDSRDFYLNHLRPSSMKKERVKIPFRGHGVTSLPGQIFFVSERYGPNACLVSWKDKTVIRHIRFPKDHIFNGHSLYNE